MTTHVKNDFGDGDEFHAADYDAAATQLNTDTDDIATNTSAIAALNAQTSHVDGGSAASVYASPLSLNGGGA